MTNTTNGAFVLAPLQARALRALLNWDDAKACELCRVTVGDLALIDGVVGRDDLSEAGWRRVIEAGDRLARAMFDAGGRLSFQQDAECIAHDVLVSARPATDGRFWFGCPAPSQVRAARTGLGLSIDDLAALTGGGRVPVKWRAGRLAAWEDGEDLSWKGEGGIRGFRELELYCLRDTLAGLGVFLLDPEARGLSGFGVRFVERI